MLTEASDERMQSTALGASHLRLKQRGQVERVPGQLEASTPASSAEEFITSPAAASRYSTVVVWCRAFSVAFTSAPLRAS
jgi:hypothetical protein